ncbi:hypothetical protein [Desulfurispira natronophila]|uniref:Ferritin-like domain-containing protein n=1 Tax=Desulfurispira natronophila TaxID=682562 RepID=A0A7W7Y3R6_9BACT|nr:hypothetical protein [Desulfurispira natronophila]MBB5021517.1 hypothetical protein [Desulfurispira natronophila]
MSSTVYQPAFRIDFASAVSAEVQTLERALLDARQSLCFYHLAEMQCNELEHFRAVAASRQQQEVALAHLLSQYSEAPSSQQQLSPALRQNSREWAESAVAAEIESLRLYDLLIASCDDHALRDILFRIQAAIHDHHLPLLRQAVELQQEVDPLALLQEVQQAVEHKDPAKWASLLTGRSGPLLGGALLGAGAIWLLKNHLNKP